MAMKSSIITSFVAASVLVGSVALALGPTPPATSKPTIPATAEAAAVLQAWDETAGTPVTRATFEARWRTMQKFLIAQSREVRANDLCSYSSLVRMKLAFFHRPDEAVDQLNGLYGTAVRLLRR